MQWYQKAAAQNCTEAQLHLVLCYKEGIGVAKNLKASLAWLKKAQASVHADA